MHIVTMCIVFNFLYVYRAMLSFSEIVKNYSFETVPVLKQLAKTHRALGELK